MDSKIYNIGIIILASWIRIKPGEVKGVAEPVVWRLAIPQSLHSYSSAPLLNTGQNVRPSNRACRKASWQHLIAPDAARGSFSLLYVQPSAAESTADSFSDQKGSGTARRQLERIELSCKLKRLGKEPISFNFLHAGSRSSLYGSSSPGLQGPNLFPRASNGHHLPTCSGTIPGSPL